MAITDVRTKINTILAEGAKKPGKPKDKDKKKRQGAPEAKTPLTDPGDICCESDVFEEVMSAPGLSPMANELLNLLRQRMEQGHFQVLTLDVIDQIKTANPNKDGEIDAAFEELKAKGLISVNDGGISTAAEHEDRPINEFFKRQKSPEDLTDQPIVSVVDGREGLALVDDGSEVAVRWAGEQRIVWVARELVEKPGAEETRAYYGPTDQVDSFTNDFMSKNSGGAAPQYSRHDFSHDGQRYTKYQFTAAPHVHNRFNRAFNVATKARAHPFRESVELTEAGIKLAVESLTLVAKS